MWLLVSPAVASDLLAPLAAIEDRVAALRGWTFAHAPLAEVMSPDALRSWFTGRWDAELPADEVSRLEAMLTLVGLVPAGSSLRDTTIELATGQIAGLYDPRVDTLYMIDRGSAGGLAVVDRMLLAHEIAHALDDQRFDLDAYQRDAGDTLDASTAASAVIEGSATVQMSRFLLADASAGEVTAGELLAYLKDEQERSAALLSAPRFYLAWFAASYVTGMAFLLDGHAQQAALTAAADPSAASLDAAVADPPRTMEAILHPEKWRAHEAPVIVDDDAVIALLGEVTHRDTLGELFVAVATTSPKVKTKAMQMADPARWTNPAAAGWGGDRFFLAGPDRGVWVTAWDTERDAKEFVAAYGKLHRGPIYVPFGPRAGAWTWGCTAKEREALAKTPPAFTQGGVAWGA